MGQADLQRIRTLVEPVLSSLGFELVDVRLGTDFGRQVLRIFIDREGGVTVGDCQKASQEMNTLLDVEEVVRERYFLEVSSPGLDRPLVKPADFVRYTGKEAVLKTSEPLEGRRNYKGLLKGMEGEEVLIVIDGQEFKVPIRLIEKANLVY